ncbi:MAG: hypothetical protein V2A73_06905 [Pseudomonadota bacterium]
MSPEDEEPTPRLPRNYRFKLPTRELMAIMMLIVALIAVVGLRKGCASGVAAVFESFTPPLDAAARTRSVRVISVDIGLTDAGIGTADASAP